MQKYTDTAATLDIADNFTFAMPTMDKRKVLLLEDEPQFRDVIKDFFSGHGFDVVAVQNGVEGVHEVLASDFEVILCDMMMPTLPGDMFFSRG